MKISQHSSASPRSTASQHSSASQRSTGSPRSTAAPHGSSSQPSPGRRRTPILIAVAVGLGAGLVLAGPLSQLLSARMSADGGASLTNPFAAWSGGMARQDVLILGTDVGGGNTDVIATLRVDGDRTSITQIPRDTYIEAESFGPVKINALYSLGGIEAVKREISQRLGRPIQHHLVVNLSAIRQMADMIGGIEVNVPKRMLYVDRSQGLSIDLQPGPQTLRGKDLEGFLRFRHDETGDLGRMDRQQLALKSLFRKLTRPEYLVRLPALMMAARKDIRTDLGPMELGGLITAMGSTHLDTQRLDGHPFYKGGISYWDAVWPTPEPGALEADTTSQDRATSSRHRFLF